MFDRNDTIISTDSVLRVPVDWASGSMVYTCEANNADGKDTEVWQLTKNCKYSNQEKSECYISGVQGERPTGNGTLYLGSSNS